MEKSWYNCNLSLSLSLFTQLFCFFCFCMLCLVLSSLLPTNQTKPNQTKKLLVYYLVNLDFVSCRLENFCPILSCPVLSECRFAEYRPTLPYRTLSVFLVLFCSWPYHANAYPRYHVMSCHVTRIPRPRSFRPVARFFINIYIYIFRQSVVNFVDLRICIF